VDGGKNVVRIRQDAETELARIFAERAAERAGGGGASPRRKGESITLSGARTREGYGYELPGILRAMGSTPAG
jgi:hypothetical protein